ncbi:hypothetical protein T01_4588 [Trichinella spiralis]|uniref:Uncharacterized protein n=1 Tax=Trichinella spiralis TaxID=6334 RepID=A0A0V1AMB4_TRISP|nr:hypothetical protein T01_4588 [Trichinella spiralis]
MTQFIDSNLCCLDVVSYGVLYIKDGRGYYIIIGGPVTFSLLSCVSSRLAVLPLSQCVLNVGGKSHQTACIVW